MDVQPPVTRRFSSKYYDVRLVGNQPNEMREEAGVGRKVHGRSDVPFSSLHPFTSLIGFIFIYLGKTMKRSSESAELEVGKVMPRRQDPVSCEFCRRKKLKCDRIGACSNCRARKLACSLSLGLCRITDRLCITLINLDGFQARGILKVATVPGVESSEDVSSR